MVFPSNYQVMQFKNQFTQLLDIEHPIIMAPMFLVSNLEMMKAGMKSGIMSVFPSLNYRNEGELENCIDRLIDEKKKNNLSGSFGVNLIVQKSNPLYQKHLQICINKKVPFYITSLGNPSEVIEKAHAYGAKVFCDVTNLIHAQKCYELGCDGFIAVGQGAGGHAGPNPLQLLIPSLKNKFPSIPVIGAGGVADGIGIFSLLALGAEGVSVGTRFIASTEASVNDAYKNAILDAEMDDIVLTSKLSGTPCTIINTDDAKKMGYEQNFIEKWLSNQPKIKKYIKMLIQLKGIKKLESSILPNNYKKLWCAGKSVELINDITTCEIIIKRMIDELEIAVKDFNKKYHN